MLETGRGKKFQCRHIFGKEIPSEPCQVGVADVKVLILVTEAHGDDFPPVLPAPGIDMSILQQVVAHLTFIACENHTFLYRPLVISKYFFNTKSDMSLSRSSSLN